MLGLYNDCFALRCSKRGFDCCLAERCIDDSIYYACLFAAFAGDTARELPNESSMSNGIGKLSSC